MYYEINVALHGQHFFATAQRSCVTYMQAKRVYEELRKRFPPEEGFSVEIRKWETIGKEVEI